MVTTIERAFERIPKAPAIGANVVAEGHALQPDHGQDIDQYLHTGLGKNLAPSVPESTPVLAEEALQMAAVAVAKQAVATPPAPVAHHTPKSSVVRQSALVQTFDVVIIGAGAAGGGVAASLLRRMPGLKLAVVEPSTEHHYQPGWTLVGGGAMDAARTVRSMRSVIPHAATWFKTSATQLLPESREVLLADGLRLRYAQLVVCPGLRLAWEQIEGLEATLGQNGVTSNYRRGLAPYTWQLVQQLKSGRALFSQPSLPIKGAAAPLSALFLACAHWQRSGVLDKIDVACEQAGGALFGVAPFVPTLKDSLERYRAQLRFHSILVKVDGPTHTAWFDVVRADGVVVREARNFDMLHVVPPQVPTDLVRASLLADVTGWCEVDHATLQSPRFPEVFALGDGCSAPNSKSVAAVRQQVPVVVENLLALRQGKALPCRYNGYSGCWFTVARGKVLLAEFGYAGRLLPTFPFGGVKPHRIAWWLQTRLLPQTYWSLLLKGRTWRRPAAKP